MSNNVGLDTWNLISGTIGVLTVLPFIWAFVRYQHPETKMAELESTLKDTEALLRSVSEEGLLDPQRHIPHFTSHLTRYRTRAEAFREETFIVSVDWRKTFVAWSHGLSKRIAILCRQVKKVRAEICETSAERRMQLMQEDTDDASPARCTWRAKIRTVWERIVFFVSRKSAVETAHIASTSLTTPVLNTSATSTEDTRNAPIVHDAETAVIARNPYPSHRSSPHAQSRKAPTHHPKSDRSPFRMPVTATHTRDVRILASATRRVDRELAAHRVSNVRLIQLAHITRKQWSPASTKVYRPRYSRKQRVPVPRRPGTVGPVRRSSQSGVDSDACYSSGDETVCAV